MRKRRTPRKVNPTFAVVVDGETEMWYLKMLQQNERDLRITIKPEIPKRKNIEEQYKRVCAFSDKRKEYDKVFWVVDFDAIIKETRETAKNKKSSLDFFIEYRHKINKKYPHVVVIVNNPCLEFWFLLHFEQTSKYFTADEAEKQLKKHMADYEKTEKYFKKANNDIYQRLRPHLTDAIRHSLALGGFSDEAPKKAMSEMELLFQSLGLD
ncbi:RloB family protein [Tannerella forsythia]|uniref:RloB domain-containing protein n=1 Tax=Tannerella forsythia TaxID=28112 RepID=A0A3P1YTB4_TANFO|nr:RloB family protein [Tannerella forsythia]RRD59144.1 RloB domain-containing protein [Tannerella forsythia]RRD73857.1 RloB domain-containing protein [Tannerella forsythia]